MRGFALTGLVFLVLLGAAWSALSPAAAFQQRFTGRFQYELKVSHDEKNGDLLVEISLKNRGEEAAEDVRVEMAVIRVGPRGTDTFTPLPAEIGRIPAGEAKSCKLKFTPRAAAPGTTAVLTFGGRHSTGRLGGSVRMRIPEREPPK